MARIAASMAGDDGLMVAVAEGSTPGIDRLLTDSRDAVRHERWRT